MAREAHYLAHPDIAADDAARRFELDAIPIPDVLIAAEGAAPWEARAHADAAALYRIVVAAGDDGLSLSEVGGHMGKERRQSALKLLRSSGVLAETRERRPDAAGRQREQVVLRERGIQR